MLSDQRLADWRGSITLFNGFFSTRPAEELLSVPWVLIAHAIAPAHGVAVVEEKERAPYFIGCALRDAPLTGKTRERATEHGQRLEGKQRSAAHVTASNILTFDLDGIAEEHLESVLTRIRAADLTALLFSTHSHGRIDKPGIRARAVLPLDMALEQPEFERAWRGVALSLFSGVDVDISSQRIHQQQGVWATAAARAALAFRHDLRGGLVDANAAIAACPETPKRAALPPVFSFSTTPKSDTAARIEEALPWSDAEETPAWIAAITAIKAASAIFGADVGRDMAVRFSAQGSATAQAGNADARYNPVEFFDRVNPTMSADAGVGALCAAARDGAAKLLRAELQSGVALTARAISAAKYLARFHPRVFSELKESTPHGYP